MAKCEECDKPLKLGQNCYWYGDPVRYFHVACFEASLTPIKDLPKSVVKKLE